MKPSESLLASIQRFRSSFWEKRGTRRPPVGIAADRAWLPIRYLRGPFEKPEILPSDVSAGPARTDYDDAFANRPVRSDDWMPFSAPWRAVPWLEAICGCRVRYSSGSLAPKSFVPSAAALRDCPIPASSEWVSVLVDQTRQLERSLPADCWLSTTILRGASDVLAAMRGLENFMTDLYDAPAPLAETASRIAALHSCILRSHFDAVRPKLEGYGHIFGYWAPCPTTVIQEDALGMCSPRIFERIFLEPNARIVESLGPCVLFHLHSTGYRHWRHVLEIPGIAGIELTVEANGPSLERMTPHLREILERSRLVLYVDGWFEQLASALKSIPREGLYLIVSDKFVSSEQDFQSLLRISF